MFQVSRQIDFSYGHRLLGYEGKCKHLHGHNAEVLITLEAADLDKQGMVLDFTEIKKTVSRWVDEHLDHRMLLHCDDPLAPLLQAAGEPMFLINANPTAENLARLISEYATDQGFPVVEVRFHETPRCSAAYFPEGNPDGRIKWKVIQPR
jgi:6-pyruvoyltetrahydropterin/6-carboxytetrahydropterin synthase